MIEEILKSTLAAIILLGLLLLGFGMGKSAITDNCRDFGAFIYDDVRYECAMENADERDGPFRS